MKNMIIFALLSTVLTTSIAGACTTVDVSSSQATLVQMKNKFAVGEATKLDVKAAEHLLNSNILCKEMVDQKIPCASLVQRELAASEKELSRYKTGEIAAGDYAVAADRFVAAAEICF